MLTSGLAKQLTKTFFFLDPFTSWKKNSRRGPLRSRYHRSLSIFTAEKEHQVAVPERQNIFSLLGRADTKSRFWRGTFLFLMFLLSYGCLAIEQKNVMSLSSPSHSVSVRLTSQTYWQPFHSAITSQRTSRTLQSPQKSLQADGLKQCRYTWHFLFAFSFLLFG